MSNNKIMLKQGVLSKGGGARRVILDRDAGLIYAYQSPDLVVGIYDKGRGWVIPEAPSYDQGGWGRPSTGDADGHYTIENAKALIRAINAHCFRVNSKQFLTLEEVKKLNAEIKKSNQLTLKRAKIAEKMGRNSHQYEIYPLETVKLSKEFVGRSPKGDDVLATARKYEDAVKVFTDRKGRPVKVDAYLIEHDRIVQSDDENRSTVVAFRDADGQVYMNSQVLMISTFERDFMGGQSMVQAEVRKIAKFNIPFNVLAAAGLNLSETRVIQQGPEEDFKIKSNQYGSAEETRHFTGALLLENAGRKFFMDVDRNEVKHKLFNVFFVEIDSKAENFEQAYESMKPDEVRNAERAGLEVKRQGEWFFIATDKTLKVQTEDVLDWLRRGDEAPKKYVLRSNVSHGKGRPNTLFKPHGFGELDSLVCGTVSHSGREHAEIDLGTEEETSSGNGNYTTFKLWKLVPNTTVANFTIEGDVD